MDMVMSMMCSCHVRTEMVHLRYMYETPGVTWHSAPSKSARREALFAEPSLQDGVVTSPPLRWLGVASPAGRVMGN